MASFTAFLVVYLFGGLTFLPLLLALAIYSWTRPVAAEDASAPSAAPRHAHAHAHTHAHADNDLYDGFALPGDDVKTLETVRREHAKERDGHQSSRRDSHGTGAGSKKPRHAADDISTAGYFAVHRKYVAMGVNLRPVESGSSVDPASVVPPSPSVYQTFFRSMLHKKAGSPDKVEISSAASPRPKNARNMFYVVLRHGHLILFDDDQQVDVRHVIKLADHDVSIDSGRATIPEGELFIKRNAVRLSPKNPERAKAHNAPPPQPWFFYCENCSEKEDFYFALLRSQARAPRPHDVDVRHLTALMERLHASEEAAEMRWFNALVGRLFLGVYKTDDVRRFVESKVITKLSRTPRPSFVASLVVQRVDIGETTPQLTSPRLKSLTAEGECIVEADVRYTGRFEIDLAATIRVSTPIGQQEVKTSLAVVLTHLEGHVLFKVKAPPSNRVWFTFRHMPKIEMETRPIVMARQLTWPVFIQMIEGKIKEAIAESIVLPFWDDTPFFPTEKKRWRGGVWDSPADDDDDGNQDGESRADSTGTGTGTATAAAGPEEVSSDAISSGAASVTTGASTPGAAAHTHDGPGEGESVSPAILRLRRLSRTHSAPPSPEAAMSPSSSTGSSRKQQQQASDAASVSGIGMSPPRRFSRTTPALASPAEPVVGTDRSHAEASIPPSSPPKYGKDASAAMSWLSSGTLRSRKLSLSSGDSASGAPPGQRPNPASSRRAANSAAAAAAAATATATATSNSVDESEDGGPEPIFSISDSETPPDGPPAGDKETARKPSRGSSASPDRRSVAPSLSTRVGSSSSLAGKTGLGRHPSPAPSVSPSRRKQFEPSVTTTITSAGSGGTPPAKRSAVLAAAMTEAAQSAKRWGINALQRRATAAAGAAGNRGKGKGPLAEHRTSSGEALDLSKPVGGGHPLPPPGVSLPMPSELSHAKEWVAASNSPAPPPPATPAAPPEQTKIKRKQLPEGSVSRRRRVSEANAGRAAAAVGYEQPQDLLVVAAPVESDAEDSDRESRGQQDLSVPVQVPGQEPEPAQDQKPEDRHEHKHEQEEEPETNGRDADDGVADGAQHARRRSQDWAAWSDQWGAEPGSDAGSEADDDEETIGILAFVESARLARQNRSTVEESTSPPLESISPLGQPVPWDEGRETH